MTEEEKDSLMEEDGAPEEGAQNDDFKYVLQDVSSLYLGRELTYAEMLEREDIPFKFKAIINGYIQKDVGLDKTITEHLLSITEEQFSYRIYEQLKLSVKVCSVKRSAKSSVKRDVKRRGGFGGGKNKWVHKSHTIQQFCEKCRKAAAAGEVQIEEISISKLALMVIGI